MNTPRELYTVGHSTHEIDAFTALLQGRGIAAIADVRRFPGSRRNPQFGQQSLAESLASEGIGYEWLEELGGRRSVVPGSPNGGWQVAAFQGYADHMASAEFAAGLERLEHLAAGVSTAVMCAEAHPSRCHRRLLSDAMTVRGWRVMHVLPGGKVERHELTAFAVVDGTRLTYPAAQGTLLEP
jgi:uncharacterized protein (DUF488 family)